MSNFEIRLLAECPEFLRDVSTLWFNELGKKWVPNASIAYAELSFRTHLNKKELPLTFVAFDENKVIGAGSLRETDGIRDDLTPWLGGLVVHPEYRHQKVGETLINVVKKQANQMGYEKLYLFALDPTIPQWYSQLGWRAFSSDHFYQHPVVVMDIEIGS